MKRQNDPDHYNEIRIAAEREAAEDIAAIGTYGSSIQGRLSEYSGLASKTVVANENFNTEKVLLDTISEIDNLSRVDKSRLLGFRKKDYYKETIANIDKMAVQLRLRQAQLLKDEVIFSRIEEIMQISQQELSIYIMVGEEYLNKKLDRNGSEIRDDLYLNEQEDWIARFKRKIEELRVTRQLAMQSEAEFHLLRENAGILAERIGNTLSITVPVWRSQAALALGLEEYADSLNIERMFEHTAKKTIRKTAKSMRSLFRGIKQKQNEIDFRRYHQRINRA